MPTEAGRGKGSKFYIGADNTTALTTADAVAQIKGAIPFPAPETEDINVTNHDSPRNSKEYIPGDDEYEAIDLELVFKETEFERLQDIKDGNAAVKMRVCLIKADGTFNGTLPNTTPRADFSGYIKKITGEAPVDNEIMARLTIKPSTAVTWTFT
jgi:hypothetical protein